MSIDGEVLYTAIGDRNPGVIVRTGYQAASFVTDRHRRDKVQLGISRSKLASTRILVRWQVEDDVGTHGRWQN